MSCSWFSEMVAQALGVSIGSVLLIGGLYIYSDYFDISSVTMNIPIRCEGDASRLLPDFAKLDFYVLLSRYGEFTRDGGQPSDAGGWWNLRNSVKKVKVDGGGSGFDFVFTIDRHVRLTTKFKFIVEMTGDDVDKAQRVLTECYRDDPRPAENLYLPQKSHRESNILAAEEPSPDSCTPRNWPVDKIRSGAVPTFLGVAKRRSPSDIDRELNSSLVPANWDFTKPMRTRFYFSLPQFERTTDQFCDNIIYPR